MAMSLIVKKLSKQPIGTQVELTCGDGAAYHEKVCGVITDSDFTSSVEITTESGEEHILDYSIIKGVVVTKPLDETLRELAVGARVRFSYGSDADREPNLSGTVTDNDCEDNVGIKTDSGREMILSYSVVRSLLVQSGGRPKPVSIPRKPISASPAQLPLWQQKPADLLSAADNELKAVFEVLPREDRVKLSSAYDSFKYGVKINDRDKMASAANQARQILFQEDQRDYYWSSDAARFCGLMLRRVNVYDSEVFLVGACFWEAALVSYRSQDSAMCGAYALLAMLEPEPAHLNDLLILLATSMVQANDASGLRILYNHLPTGFEPHLRTLIEEAFRAKGIQTAAGQSVEHSLTTLETLYPNTAIAEEVNAWMDEPPEEKGTESRGNAAEIRQPEPPKAPETISGVISRLNWADHTGVITCDNGETCTFRYQDIANPALQKTIQECLRSDLDGKIYMVKFYLEKGMARNVQPENAAVDRARAIAADTTRADRFEVAYQLCRGALETPDARRAIVDLIKHTITIYSATQNTAVVEDAMEQYRKYSSLYPTNAFAVMDVARCYSYLKQYPAMLEHAGRAVSTAGLNVKQKLSLLSQYLRMCKEYYDSTHDRTLLVKTLEKVKELTDLYSRELDIDPQAQNTFLLGILPYRAIAECGLDMLEEAEADYARVPPTCSMKSGLDELMRQTRERLAPAPVMPAEEPAVREDPDPVDQTEIRDEEEPYMDAAGEEESEEEIVPYEDRDGWNALQLSEKSVIDYALSITGPDRIPAMLAYLKAGSLLNPKITPVYRTVALAVNDPMDAPDYSITALVDALAGSDSDYPMLNDCCMAAAFLRASFLSGRGYDYSAQGLRDSIAITQKLPALRDAYDTLEAFRKEAGRAIDIYADYRNQGVRKLEEDLDGVVHHADELYTKFILTSPREGVKFARLLETKKIVFARDGYLAEMLRHILERDNDTLEAEKDGFVLAYLNGVPQFSAKHISANAVDSLISRSWDQAGKNMQFKKVNATLQGDRRNNLRSNISDVLGTICQWYGLCEQSAGLTWRTTEGAESYARLRPQLMAQLDEVSRTCDAEMEECLSAEYETGLFLLSATARELSARLDGSWKFEQEKFTYVDFLRSDQVMLNEDFMPDLSSTFCALPEFNILARIRKHVEGPKLGFQEHIDRIYGVDKTCNNYGTAERIMEYLRSVGSSETVTLPENAEQFVSQTELQIDMRYRGFRESYALAMNYGQIMQSDAFCYTLEDTVRYWHAFCSNTKNYGFFTSILLQAENQIHASAQQYEEQLDEQLDALIASSRQQFDEHPGYAEAIRGQIAQQNFIVAEDWMHRIRLGDFSLEVQQPEALGYLEDFWTSYVATYNRVADSGRPLSALLGRREARNKDTKHAQQLIDNWLNSGSPSTPARMTQLLNLLGWQNIQVCQYRFAAEPRTEMYYVTEEASAAGMTTPLHPIAAFGSKIAQDGMYVACLYGTYDCDRLYEKIRTMDAIDGSKVILLDYALGGADRRALARKLKKKESGLRNVYLVIDRVLICHLANNYNENLINRILMAIGMPFSYCQPYVVESSLTMPPEIFIGRKDELLKIEQPDGVNLIYGGRQLGKSALFKKARSDLDGNQQRRAVLVDIKECSCASAARKLSAELIDLGILPDTEVTEDWEVLCRSIKQRLRQQDKLIRYLLVMLDEADAFIDDCSNFGYKPLVALKDVQQSLPGQFKFVLAGLHNIVRFNRDVALGKNSVITHLPSLKITPFRTPEAQELLTVPLSYLGFSLPSKVTVSQILATVNYFPGLIQLYCQKLIESIRAVDYAGYDVKKTPPYVITDDHLRRVMADKEFVEQIHEKFEITLRLDQDQGSCYYPLTLLIGWMYSVDPAKSGYTARDVLRHAKDLTVYPLMSLDEEKIDALLQELRDLNILRNVSNNTYLLASKNFRDLLGSDDEIFEKLTKVGVAAV